MGDELLVGQVRGLCATSLFDGSEGKTFWQPGPEGCTQPLSFLIVLEQVNCGPYLRGAIKPWSPVVTDDS